MARPDRHVSLQTPRPALADKLAHRTGQIGGNMKFVQAIRRQSRARVGLTGPSGSGKTYSALLLAKGLGGRIAVIDTEHGSASLYAGMKGMPVFDVLEFAPPYSPERFIAALQAAASGGYDVILLDSITPEWNGSGGCLEINDHIASTKYKGNTWSAWSETTPRHRKFIDALLATPAHLIVTMRSKTETAQTDNNGKKSVVKLGMKPEQRDGIEYEMTTVLDLIHDGHYAVATKDRTGLWMGGDPAPITEATGKRLREWLETGAEIVEAPAIPEADREAFIKSIKETPDIDTLKARFTTAYTLAVSTGDNEARDLFVEAKDKRKAELDAFAPENKRVAV